MPHTFFFFLGLMPSSKCQSSSSSWKFILKRYPPVYMNSALGTWANDLCFQTFDRADRALCTSSGWIVGNTSGRRVSSKIGRLCLCSSKIPSSPSQEPETCACRRWTIQSESICIPRRTQSNMLKRYGSLPSVLFLTHFFNTHSPRKPIRQYEVLELVETSIAEDPAWGENAGHYLSQMNPSEGERRTSSYWHGSLWASLPRVCL